MFIAFCRGFKPKHSVAVNGKLVQLLLMYNFCVYTILRFCENFCANLENMSYHGIFDVFIAFSIENLLCCQEQTCWAVKTEQLSCLQLFCFCENFYAHLGNVSYQLVFRAFLAYLFGNLVNHQLQTCSAAETEQLWYGELFTVQRKFLLKPRHKV